MKSIVIAGLLFSAAHGSVVSAGPYANVESNAGWTGSDFNSSITEVHAGYEFDNGIYVQGGPAFISTEGTEGSTEVSGKVGATAALSEDLDVYGEVAFLTDDQSFEFDELNFGTKVGVTYRF